jgi:hypothetical protein
MSLSRRDIDHIFEALRSGRVPERGMDSFAVGTDRARTEMGRLLDLVDQGQGVFKFLRGGYGCGKTFSARLTVADALDKGFAASFVVVSDNDLHFHKFDELYRKVVGNLATAACPRGALGDILDRWVGRIEESLIQGGADPDGPGFDTQVSERIRDQVQAATNGVAPADFTRVVQTIFACKQQGKLADATALISWLSGSRNVSGSAKQAAGIRGEIGSPEAMAYLHGILAVVKAAGYKGMVLVIDEAETILRMRKDVRGKSLNGIRQIIDDAPNFSGLLWVFTGTPEFFDTRRGVGGLEPLEARIRFSTVGNFASPRQAQLELQPFNAERLREVALKLRALYPAQDRGQLESKAGDDFVDRLVAQVTSAFGGDVGVVPRQFLRKFVEVMDLVDQEPDFDPATELGLNRLPELKELTETERRKAKGEPPYDAEPGDDGGYEPAALTW